MIPHHLRLVKVVEYCKAHVGEVLTVESAQAMFDSKTTKNMVENTFNRVLDVDENFSLFVDGLVYETPDMQRARIARFRKQQLLIAFAELKALEQEEKELLDRYMKDTSRLNLDRAAIQERIRKVM